MLHIGRYKPYTRGDTLGVFPDAQGSQSGYMSPSYRIYYQYKNKRVNQSKNQLNNEIKDQANKQIKDQAYNHVKDQEGNQLIKNQINNQENDNTSDKVLLHSETGLSNSSLSPKITQILLSSEELKETQQFEINETFIIVKYVLWTILLIFLFIIGVLIGYLAL